MHFIYIFILRTALHYCVENSSPNCIRLLISFGGANPNVIDLSYLTPLHYCAIHNCEESLQELLDAHDLKVNVIDQNKRLPLHYAAATGNITILSTLADVNYLNRFLEIESFYFFLFSMITNKLLILMDLVRYTTPF